MTSEERGRVAYEKATMAGLLREGSPVEIIIAAIRDAQNDALERAIESTMKCSAMAMEAGRIWRVNDDGSVSEVLPETYWVRVDEVVDAIRALKHQEERR